MCSLVAYCIVEFIVCVYQLFVYCVQHLYISDHFCILCSDTHEPKHMYLSAGTCLCTDYYVVVCILCLVIMYKKIQPHYC